MTRRHKVLFGALVFGFVCFVGWPTIDAVLIRHRVTNTLGEADAVRLEEFAFHQTLASVELPRADWSRIVEALPVVPDFGMHGSVKMCFIPHHRIVIIGHGQQHFELTICFDCDQFSTRATGIMSTPYLWRGPLRRLFASHQLPVLSGREYDEKFFRTAKPAH